MKKIFELLSEIRPADQKAMEAARLRWNSVAKPIGSLGILEEDIIKIAGILGNAERIPLEKSALAVMCADHGVVEEGVTQTGQEVTRIVAENFTKGLYVPGVGNGRVPGGRGHDRRRMALGRLRQRGPGSLCALKPEGRSRKPEPGERGGHDRGPV